MDPFLEILHPDHVAYLRHSPLNTIDYLFAVLDKIDPEKRDMFMTWAYSPIINPRRRERRPSDKKWKDQYIDEVSYEAFKNKCAQILAAGVLDQMLLTHLIVSFILHHMLSIADITSIDKKMEELRDTTDFIAAKVEQGYGGKTFTPDAFEQFEEMTRTMPERTKQNYALYEFFCENVLHELQQQKINFSGPNPFDESD